MRKSPVYRQSMHAKTLIIDSA